MVIVDGNARMTYDASHSKMETHMSDVKAIASERNALVAGAIEKIQTLRSQKGDTREVIHEIRDILKNLAKRTDLFATEEFQPPTDPQFQKIRFYELAASKDEAYVLYLSANEPGKSFPPHNHHSWAVVVGIEGIEENRLYKRFDLDGRSYVEQIDSVAVEPGVGLGLMPEDIHSIHVPEDFKGTRCLQFRMYEKPISEQSSREIFAIGRDGKVPTLKNAKPPLDIVKIA